jgi:very-short-patch-repair endonuclease
MRLAERQLGFVHRLQLRAAGLGRGAIEHRVARRWLHPYHRDVYLVGRRLLERLGLAMAAVLHFRGRAVVSHTTAASIWGLTEDASVGALPAVVTVVGVDARSRPGLKVHRAAQLERSDLRRRLGLPVSSPARALLELAGESNGLRLETALAVCRRERLATDADVLAAVDRAPRHPGAGTLRALLARAGGAAMTRSEAERTLLGLIRAAELPQPLSNVKLEGVEVDLLWREQRLVVEIDGFAFHGDRAAFERDRRRDQRLAAAGYRVMRVTWRQLRDEPYAVIARLSAALAGG